LGRSTKNGMQRNKKYGERKRKNACVQT